MDTSTWTWIELVWTVANVIGVLANIRLVRLAAAKRAAVLQIGGTLDGPRVASGNRYIRNDAGRAVCHLIGVAIGVYAMFVGDHDPILDAVTGWTLVAVMVVLMALALFDLLDERRIDRILAREQEQGGPRGRHLR